MQIRCVLRSPGVRCAWMGKNKTRRATPPVPRCCRTHYRRGTGMHSSHRDNIVDRPIGRTETQQIGASSFAFLFSELVQYTVGRTADVDKIEARLTEVGYRVGIRLLELLAFREKAPKREIKLLGVLHKFSNPTFWELFYTKAPTLQKVLGKAGEDDAEGQYMIRCSDDLLVNKYISSPKKDENSDLNPGAFVAGVVKGMLAGAGFPADVTAHYWGEEGGQSLPTTVILIRFHPSVLERESKREGKK